MKSETGITVLLVIQEWLLSEGLITVGSYNNFHRNLEYWPLSSVHRITGKINLLMMMDLLLNSNRTPNKAPLNDIE